MSEPSVKPKPKPRVHKPIFVSKKQRKINRIAKKNASFTVPEGNPAAPNAAPKQTPANRKIQARKATPAPRRNMIDLLIADINPPMASSSAKK
jgi:hypothetical protein